MSTIHAGICIGGACDGQVYGASASGITIPLPGSGDQHYVWQPFYLPPVSGGFWVPANVPEPERGAYVRDHITRACKAQTGA